MAREEKTHSDIESDEEFAEITSDELSSFYFEDKRVFSRRAKTSAEQEALGQD